MEHAHPTSTRSPAGAVALGGVATVVCILPAFLTGALAVTLQRDLAFGSAALGLAVALYRATGAATAPLLGRVADRLGATRSMRLATLLGAAATLGIALTARRWATLVAWLMVAGCANALVQPGANRMLARIVRPGRLGLAFGLKQSAPPTASMLAGLSLPLVALTLGWRWAYGIAALLALLVSLSVGRTPPRPDASADAAPTRTDDRRFLLLLTTAFGFATSTSGSITTFFVDAAVRAGSTERSAGIVLAAASVTAIAVRVTAGWRSDRLVSGHLRICAALLTAGSLGIFGLASGDPRWMAVSAVVALAGAWGFNGVFVYTLVRAHPGEPGRITGSVMPGALLGGTIGPPLFGLIVAGAGYRPAWLLVGCIALLAAAGLRFSGHRLYDAAGHPLA